MAIPWTSCSRAFAFARLRIARYLAGSSIAAARATRRACANAGTSPGGNEKASLAVNHRFAHSPTALATTMAPAAMASRTTRPSPSGYVEGMATTRCFTHRARHVTGRQSALERGRDPRAGSLLFKRRSARGHCRRTGGRPLLEGRDGLEEFVHTLATRQPPHEQDPGPAGVRSRSGESVVLDPRRPDHDTCGVDLEARRKFGANEVAVRDEQVGPAEDGPGQATMKPRTGDEAEGHRRHRRPSRRSRGGTRPGGRATSAPRSSPGSPWGRQRALQPREVAVDGSAPKRTGLPCEKRATRTCGRWPSGQGCPLIAMTSTSAPACRRASACLRRTCQRPAGGHPETGW